MSGKTIVRPGIDRGRAFARRGRMAAASGIDVPSAGRVVDFARRRRRPAVEAMAHDAESHPEGCGPDFREIRPTVREARKSPAGMRAAAAHPTRPGTTRKNTPPCRGEDERTATPAYGLAARSTTIRPRPRLTR